MPKLPVNAALGSCMPGLAISRPHVGVVPLCRHFLVTPAPEQEAPAGTYGQYLVPPDQRADI